VPPGHVAAPDPPRRYVGSTVREVRMGAGGPGPLGGSESSAVGSELPFPVVTWRHRIVPERGAGPEPLVR